MASSTVRTLARAPATTAARRLTAHPTVHAEVNRWIPRTDHEAFATATRTSLWPLWLGVATAQPAVLTEPGDSTDGTLVVGSRAVAVTWTVRRRLRDIVTVDATRDGRTVATLVMGFGCWYDGCVAELRLTSAVGSAVRLRRTLGRSLGRLEELIDPMIRPPPHPTR